MAILHKAELCPTKPELLADWLPDQSWFIDQSLDGDSRAALAKLGSFRFDDPDGEVGMEADIVATGGSVIHIPLTYRDSPLAGAEAGLVGTTEHSVLGTRWIYDATVDPVYWTALAATILDGMPQAEQFFLVDGRLEPVSNTVIIQPVGSDSPAHTTDRQEHRIKFTDREISTVTDGAVTTITYGRLSLSVFRVLDTRGLLHGTTALTATWQAQLTPVQLACAD